MVESGAGEWGRLGSERMTHTMTATSRRMCSQALVRSCGWGRVGWAGGVGGWVGSERARITVRAAAPPAEPRSRPAAPPAAPAAGRQAGWLAGSQAGRR